MTESTEGAIRHFRNDGGWQKWGWAAGLGMIAILSLPVLAGWAMFISQAPALVNRDNALAAIWSIRCGWVLGATCRDAADLPGCGSRQRCSIPDGFAFVVAEDESVGALHHFAGQDHIGFTLLDL